MWLNLRARPPQKRLLNVTFNDFKLTGILKQWPFPLTQLRQQLCRKATKHGPG
jgi:hypothetical protein